MPDLTAETLTAAAKRLRSFINAIPPNSWDERPWHVEECADTTMGECPCIVAQGERAHWSEAQVPSMQYVADAETPEYARYIALMHPGVGLAIADWLEHTAEFLRGVEQTHGTVTDLALHNSRHALAVARALLGGVS